MEAAGGKGVIVTDPVTSAGMASYIASCGGQHDRFMMGYRNVIDRAADTQPEPALLAIETSGHSAWKDNRFVDDGTYTAARLIGRLARARREQGNPQLGLLDLVGDSLQEPRESIKVKMAVAAGLSGVPEAEAALCEALRRTAAATDGWDMEPVNHDGLRCAVEAAGGSGWLIIRGSLHEPSVSVQTESDVAGGTATICEQLLRFEQGACEAAGIDLQPLRDQAAAAAAAAAAATAATPEGAASTARTGGGPRMSAAVGGASRSSTCRVCRSSYDPSDNGPLACRFHPGSLRGESLCGRQPRTGFGQFALQHAPPAPDRAQGGPQPRPASANWQTCSGWPAIPALLSTWRRARRLERAQHNRERGEAAPAALCLSVACRVGGFGWVAWLGVYAGSRAGQQAGRRALAWLGAGAGLSVSQAHAYLWLKGTGDLGTADSPTIAHRCSERLTTGRVERDGVRLVRLPPKRRGLRRSARSLRWTPEATGFSILADVVG